MTAPQQEQPKGDEPREQLKRLIIKRRTRPSQLLDDVLARADKRCAEELNNVDQAFCQLPPTEEIARYADHLRGKFDQRTELKEWLHNRRAQLTHQINERSAE